MKSQAKSKIELNPPSWYPGKIIPIDTAKTGLSEISHKLGFSNSTYMLETMQANQQAQQHQYMVEQQINEAKLQRDILRVDMHPDHTPAKVEVAVVVESVGRRFREETL